MLLRCSSLGLVMGNSKGKQPYGLSATAQKVIKDIVDAECYNTPITFDNKYVKKGRECEDAAIQLFNSVFMMDLVKNDVRLSNEWITGEADLLDDDLVIDIKNSWSVEQFAEMRRKPTDYEWQLRGYMWLYDKSKACTAHTLINTPENLCKYDGAAHNFDHIPNGDRVIIGNVIEREEKYEEMIKVKHQDCLAFYHDLKENFKQGRELPC